MEPIENKEKETNKCSSCGANTSLEKKYCDYCGTVNMNYKEKSKSLSVEDCKNTGGIADIFGGILQSLTIGKELVDFIENNKN